MHSIVGGFVKYFGLYSEWGWRGVGSPFSVLDREASDDLCFNRITLAAGPERQKGDKGAISEGVPFIPVV